MEFSRPEYWSGQLFPSPGTQGSNPSLPHCRQILYQLSPSGKPVKWGWCWQTRIRGRCGVGAVCKDDKHGQEGWETGTAPPSEIRDVVAGLFIPQAAELWLCGLGAVTERDNLWLACRPRSQLCREAAGGMERTGLQTQAA